MTTPDTVPDLLSALRSGRYPHDFARAITGPIATQRGMVRATALDQLLAHDRGGEAFTNAMIVAARIILSRIGDAAASATGRAVDALADADEEALDMFADNPSEMFRP